MKLTLFYVYDSVMFSDFIGLFNHLCKPVLGDHYHPKTSFMPSFNQFPSHWPRHLLSADVPVLGISREWDHTLRGL